VLNDDIQNGVIVCKPVLLHPILMSIIFEHCKQLKKIDETFTCDSNDNKIF
jgi:hypothetical protein